MQGYIVIQGDWVATKESTRELQLLQAQAQLFGGAVSAHCKLTGDELTVHPIQIVEEETIMFAMEDAVRARGETVNS